MHDPLLAVQAVRGVLHAARALGLAAAGLAASPLAGARGNREYLLHLRPVADAAAEVSGTGGSDPSEWEARIRRVTKGAEA